MRRLSRNIFENPISSQLVTDQHIISFWIGYFRVTSKSSPSFCTVAYPPIVDETPNDMTTVYTTMNRCVEICTKTGQQHSIQTFDQQLYAIPQQVKWSNTEEFKYDILRIEGFHMLSCFIAYFGKLWSNGGLSYLPVESGIYASCTVEQMLSGKQFNRAVRALALLL